MDLYTLDQNFVKLDVVDDFNSIIWTERYSKSGDVSLLVPLTPANVAKFSEGTFLSTPGTQEVMQIESALRENGQLKLTGPTLDRFLNERLVRASAVHAERSWTYSDPPGTFISNLVSQMCILGGGLSDFSWGFDGPREIIPNLSLGDTDNSGDSITYAVPYGPVYDVVETLAQSYSLGFSLYLEFATIEGYSLKFKVYKGRDLTSDNGVYPVVRFSPSMDSLANVKTLRSIAGYKNVAYAFAPNETIASLTTTPGVAFADGDAETSIGFNRRVLMVFCDDLTTDIFNGSSATLLEVLNQRAKDALANNNYIKVVDGEVIPTAFQFGVDYGLGDIVELESDGIAQHARITEYIRAQDATGERAYPTVSVI